MKFRIQKRVLFVWDGTHEMIREAMKQSGHVIQDHAGLFAIHAMPHESIYTYGATVNEGKRPPAEIQDLTEEFEFWTNIYPCFQSVKLTVVFGDRIRQICLSAKRVKADLIVGASFKQSGFSKWIHGDLNQRLVSCAPCEVLFVGDVENNRNGTGSGHHWTSANRDRGVGGFDPTTRFGKIE